MTYRVRHCSRRRWQSTLSDAIGGIGRFLNNPFLTFHVQRVIASTRCLKTNSYVRIRTARMNKHDCLKRPARRAQVMPSWKLGKQGDVTMML